MSVASNILEDIAIEASKKRVREEIKKETIPRRIVNHATIFTMKLPRTQLKISWYAFQSDEILSFFLTHAKSENHSLSFFIEQIRRHRANLCQETMPQYDREVGAGHISEQSLYFILECKALLVENRRSHFVFNSQFLESRGFYMPRKTVIPGPDFENILLQSELLFNVTLLQNLWYSLELSLTDAQKLLDYLQYEAAKIILTKMTNTDILDGIAGQEVIQTRDTDGMDIFSVSMTFVDHLAHIFLGCFTSLFFSKRCLIDEGGVRIRDWNQQIMKPQDIENDWTPNVTRSYYEWFEDQSRVYNIPAFRRTVVNTTMTFNMRPGDREIVYTRNKKIETSDPKKIFTLTRSPLQTAWWMEYALDPGMLINFKRLKETSRDSTSTVAQCLLFDSFLQAKHKFDWLRLCCFSESRFREEYLSVIPHKMPTIVKLRSSWYVYMKHTYYLCHTIERAIYLWVYFMKSCYSFVYKTMTMINDLDSLKWVWTIWTTKPSVAPPIQQRQQVAANNRQVPQAAGAAERQEQREIIIDEGSIFTTYDYANDNIGHQQQIEQREAGRAGNDNSGGDIEEDVFNHF